MIIKIFKILSKLLLVNTILFSSVLSSKNKLDIIVIDAGHGGKDPGTMGDSGVKEKDITLAIALKFGEMIQKSYPDIKILFTRKSDDFIEVKDRTIMANSNKAKLFISIHVNHKKLDETEKNGFEIYLLNKDRIPEAIAITEKENSTLPFKQFGNNEIDKYIFSNLAQVGFIKYGEFLSHYFEMNIIDKTHLFSRGIIQAGFWVLLASMPSILIETGYISDPNDEKYLSSSQGQTDIANALCLGFSNYKITYEMDTN